MGTDPWQPTTPLQSHLLTINSDPKLTMAHLINQTTHQWDENEILRLIQRADHHLIHKLYLPHWPTSDSYLWISTQDGNYSVKPGYWTAVNLNLDDDAPTPPLENYLDIAMSIWKLGITPKLKHFI